MSERDIVEVAATGQQSFPVNLAKKIHKILAGSGYLKKDKKNAQQGFNYISEEAMVKRLRELLIEHGVILIPDVINCQTLTVNVTTSKGERAVPITRVAVRYTVVDVDSGESWSFSMVGDGTDTQDKAVYKALTGCNKYALMKLCQIPTGDDPEKDWAKDEPEEPQPAAPSKKDLAFYDAVKGELSKVTNSAKLKIYDSLLGSYGVKNVEEIKDSKLRMRFVSELKAKLGAVAGNTGDESGKATS